MDRSARRFALMVVILVAVGIVVMKMGGGGVAAVPPAFATGLTLEQAIERSTTSGRPVVVFATADWCGPCQQFKRGPLNDAEVAGYIGDHFEAVYLDVDRESELASRLGVESVPAMRILRPGQPPAELEGYTDKDRLMGWLRSVEKS